MTATNDLGVLFAEVHEHGSRSDRVPVRSSETNHNYEYRTSPGTRTAVSLGRGARFLVARRIPHDISRQVVVEPPGGGAHPLYPNMDLSPRLFDKGQVPFIDGLLKVQRPAVAEVQSGPEVHR